MLHMLKVYLVNLGTEKLAQAIEIRIRHSSVDLPNLRESRCV